MLGETKEKGTEDAGSLGNTSLGQIKESKASHSKEAVHAKNKH